MSGPRLLLPLFLDVAGKDILVVGAGVVAERKVTELLEAGASVRIVAKDATEKLAQLASSGDVILEQRAFEIRDLEGAWLVVAATDRDDVQQRIATAADRARIFCLAVDDPKNASAYGGSVLRRGAMLLAISTSGEAPALARLFREIIEEILPGESWIEEAQKLREHWKREKTPMTDRFGELLRTFYERTRADRSDD